MKKNITPTRVRISEGKRGHIYIDGKYEGNDNYGRPKSIFLKELADDTDEALFEHCKHFIWLSAYAFNNPRSDYHWQCDACYDECDRRGKVKEIYSRAHRAVSQG